MLLSVAVATGLSVLLHVGRWQFGSLGHPAAPPLAAAGPCG